MQQRTRRWASAVSTCRRRRSASPPAPAHSRTRAPATGRCPPRAPTSRAPCRSLASAPGRDGRLGPAALPAAAPLGTTRHSRPRAPGPGVRRARASAPAREEGQRRGACPKLSCEVGLRPLACAPPLPRELVMGLGQERRERRERRRRRRQPRLGPSTERQPAPPRRRCCSCRGCASSRLGRCSHGRVGCCCLDCGRRP